tara:strand:+ start:1089 stop:1412 length:324 start_codon:yes stop_codon:yes gene_type:complete
MKAQRKGFSKMGVMDEWGRKSDEAKELIAQAGMPVIIPVVNDVMLVDIPKGSFNVNLTYNSTLCADSNDSANWWTLVVPLRQAKGKWIIVKEIKTNSGATLVLEDRV